MNTNILAQRNAKRYCFIRLKGCQSAESPKFSAETNSPFLAKYNQNPKDYSSSAAQTNYQHRRKKSCSHNCAITFDLRVNIRPTRNGQRDFTSKLIDLIAHLTNQPNRSDKL